MSTFKEYAKKAKNRLKSGFWEQAKKDIDTEAKRAQGGGRTAPQTSTADLRLRRLLRRAGVLQASGSHSRFGRNYIQPHNAPC